jgi:hypothetical protein
MAIATVIRPHRDAIFEKNSDDFSTLISFLSLDLQGQVVSYLLILKIKNHPLHEYGKYYTNVFT